MKTFCIFPLVLLQLLLLSIAHTALAEDRDTDLPPEKISKYMRIKLVHSQKLLEALALEDYEQMVKHAQDLKLLSQESIWNVLQTEQYVQHSTDFRRRADALTAAAKKKNLDGASLAFVELTLNCVQCHNTFATHAKRRTLNRQPPHPNRRRSLRPSSMTILTSG